MCCKAFLVEECGGGSFRRTIRTDLRKTALQRAADAIDTAASELACPRPPHGTTRPPLEPAAETFAISTELARGVRNAILLAGYESETADIKATETAVPFLHCA
ncbi:unnamed protein product [Arctia plantaginis]|uniref:Uncharacterized protein n=1 Tax=Arctia plantaginis TaxID=874455 RepID=A0A8S0YR93_ARCPL|nr:unnamed protein product [Arctia plantaginis]CAB3261430.1 unnamed protein product [Arctia plantaginis]